MTQSDYLLKLQDILQREAPVLKEDLLSDYSEWDSLAKMAVMAFYSRQFKINLVFENFKSLHTVSDLMRLAGDQIK